MTWEIYLSMVGLRRYADGIWCRETLSGEHCMKKMVKEHIINLTAMGDMIKPDLKCRLCTEERTKAHTHGPMSRAKVIYRERCHRQPLPENTDSHICELAGRIRNQWQKVRHQRAAGSCWKSPTTSIQFRAIKKWVSREKNFWVSKSL